MNADRRSLLKGLAAAATLTVIPASEARARERRKAPPDAVGLLYDTTRCVGCKACVVACKEANGMPPDVDGYGGGLYDAPEGLNEFTKNVIQLYQDGGQQSYVKKQCMHCIDPACVGACMLGAMHKGPGGVVSYDVSKCVGCRYCETVCPFNVPKFEWTKKAPKIVKCELCRHRLAEGKQPACSEVCPRQAVIFGKYTDLLTMRAGASRRIRAATSRRSTASTSWAARRCSTSPMSRSRSSASASRGRRRCRTSSRACSTASTRASPRRPRSTRSSER